MGDLFGSCLRESGQRQVEPRDTPSSLSRPRSQQNMVVDDLAERWGRPPPCRRTLSHRKARTESRCCPAARLCVSPVPREPQCVRIVEEIVLINSDHYAEPPACVAALKEIRGAVAEVVWPPGASTFTIFPQSGKKSGEGNGVVPIRTSFILALERRGWHKEALFPLETDPGGAKFGSMDAAKSFGDEPPFLVEWETGNISSSHRALNKMGLGLIAGVISGAVLVVPTRALAQYLTDRIGNLRELMPYLNLWRALPVARGYFGIVAVEQDATSTDVPRITKGTDGRALL